MFGCGDVREVPDEALETGTDAASKAAEELRNLQGILGREINREEILIEAEHASRNEIRDVLQRSSFTYTLLFEEARDESGDGRYTWLVDPLDGTDSFRSGNAEYAVSIALYDHGPPSDHGPPVPVLGVVNAPAQDRVFTASIDDPAKCDGDEIEVDRGTDIEEQATLVAGYDRGGEFLREAASDIAGWDRRSSAALNLCELAIGQVHGHWEYSTYPWDIAAGLVIASRAGARVTDKDNRPFVPELEPTGGERKSLLASNGEFHDFLAGIAD